MFAPEQQQQQAAPDSTASLPQRWLPILKDYIVSLGFTLQQLEASGGAAVQGSKQLRIVLGRAVLEAHTQLVAACAAAVDSTCNSAGGLTDAAAVQGGGHGSCGSAANNHAAAVQQLCSTGAGMVLADSLISFGSLLCAALPTRFCCNEPSCCCLERPTELQLAAGKGSKCSACGTARYCGAADQRKHWKQHKQVCKAVSAAAEAAPAGKGKRGTRKDKVA
jgi:hypothetical protein